MMLLEQILLYVPCPIFWKNKTGEFLGCNKLFLEVAGFSDNVQLIGKTDGELPWKEYKEEYLKDDQYVLTTGKTITKTENIPLRGRMIISETTKAPLIHDGKAIGILGICHDITDRVKAEQLRVKIEKYEAIEAKNKLFKDFTRQMTGLINQFQALNDRGESELNTPDDNNIKLTKREQEILYFLSRGKKPKDIAIKLDISSKTVQNIIDGQLFPKLGTHNIGDLIEKAHMLNLIPFTL